jgi:tRNA(Ile)-lysidine synthase
MIRFLGQIPRKCTVAFSGGVDSVAIADFLVKGKRDVTLAFFHHGTEASDNAARFVVDYARKTGTKLVLGNITTSKPSGVSQEEFWRNQRYAFLSQFSEPVVTAHHLDDAVETWIFTSLHGESRLIPYQRGNVIRPFLLTPKTELHSWCKKNSLQWEEDTSNTDTKFMRNFIRHKIVPEALKVNPGLRTLIRKRYLALGTNAGLISV